MSRSGLIATLVAGLAMLSLLVAFVACNGDSRGSEPEARPTTTAVSPSTPTPTATDPTPDYDVELARENLAAAKKTWRSEGSDNYSLDVQMSCECTESGMTLRLTVRNGVIQSVYDVYSGEMLTEKDLVYAYKTADDWFREIESALRGRPDVFGASYHPSLGYPTSFGVTNNLDVPDDGFSLKQLSYTPEDPDAPPRPLYDVVQARNELAAAKARWEAEGSDDYIVGYRIWCECPEDDTQFNITVRNGAIESVIDETSEDALTEDDFLYGYKTIDNWFELIEDVLGSRPAHYLSVEYDYSSGLFLNSLIVRYEYGAADDDFILTRWGGITPLAPSLPTVTPEASSINNPRDVSATDLFSDRPGSSAVASSRLAYRR